MADEPVTDNGLPEDAFDLAFAAASGVDELPPEPVVEEPKVEEPAAEAPPVEAEPKIEEPKAEEPVVAAPQAAEPKPEPAPEPKPVEPPAPAVDTAQEAADAIAALSAKEAPTEEEQAVLAQVKEDFPEVAQAFEVYQRTVLAKVESMVAAKVNELTSQFAPAVAVAHKVARNEHEAAILKDHPDAFTIVDAVGQWVEKQPSFLQKTYNAVLDNGSAAEIVELLSIYKKEIGSAQVPPPPSQETAEQKAAKEKKLQSQESVRVRQAAQKSGIDENDFESAFAMAANQ